MKVIMMHFTNGLQLIGQSARETEDNLINPFQIITRPSQNGQVEMSMLAFAPYSIVDSEIGFNTEHVLASYVTDDKRMINSYENSVADLKQKRSGIITPTKKLDLV
jgi:hypothetical protein